MAQWRLALTIRGHTPCATVKDLLRGPAISSARCLRCASSAASGKGVVKVIKVSTEDNEADIFTKPLDRASFERHRDTLMNVAAASH